MSDDNKDFNSWKAQREASCRDPSGWLSLVGLHWLKEGINTIGKGSGNDVVFEVTNPCPEKVGAVTLHQDNIRFKAEAGVKATANGNEMKEEIELRHDNDGEASPTIVQHGSLQWFVIKRSQRYAIRAKDSESAVLKNFKGLEYFPYNPSLNLKGKYVPYDPPKIVTVVEATGDKKPTPVPGKITFSLEEREYALDVTGDPKTKLFLVFSDKTAGKETYGGGRFLYIVGPEKDNSLTINFNQAYNPPCVFTPYATCPLPTPENRLNVEIRAGEKVYGDH